jgi:GntR family transcriptional regulator, transcriptional repressor for pyruvate dehydrogenase complex
VKEVSGVPKPLRRETLAEQVADGLIALIENDELAPGTLLPSEISLAQEFGVSRPIVREALKALAAKDVVAIANGKGAIVRPLSSDPLQDFFRRVLRVRHATMVELLEVRRGIEVQSATLAAQRRTAAQLSELTGVLAAMRQHVRDAETFRLLDTEFHLLVASAAHNTLLYHFVESMREPMQDSMRAVSRRRITEVQHQFAHTAHARIVDAIARRAPEAAARAMATHFDEAIKLITEGQANGSA